MSKKAQEKRRLFVHEYLVDLNGAAAARRAGYAEANAKVQASNLLADPRIQQAIQAAMQERAQRTDISADRVLRELSRLAFFDARRLYDSDGAPLPLQQLDNDTAAAVVGLDRVAIGNEQVGFGEVHKIKLADKLGALTLIGRHLGMWNDKLNVNAHIRGTTKVLKVPAKEFAKHVATEQASATVPGPAAVPRKAWAPLS
jgi:phage terminase small subunit